jgi:hypothetical protein
MLDILDGTAFREHYANGFVQTGITLPAPLVEEIRAHYLAKARGHNDFPKFFVDNEHQAYLEGWLLGAVFNAFPKFARKTVARFYDKAYDKAVYCEQACIEKVLRYAMDNGLPRLFRTRYMVAGYDMYLRNNHRSPAAGIHTDLPNFHHFYETENDLSLYIPLVDFDEANGGRLKVLPKDRLKVPGNVLLRLLREHFGARPEYLDANGFIDPDRIDAAALDEFIRSKPHQELMAYYKGVTRLAKREYAGDFRLTDEPRGRVLMFSNKDFHAAEPWKNAAVDREVYVIRMFPLYDAKIALKSRLHGTPVNNYLLDMERGEVTRREARVDVGAMPREALLTL